MVGGGGEGVGAGGAKVEGEVDAELLDHEADGGDHGNAAVLELGVLEPLDGVGAGVLEDPGTERRALVAGLYRDTKGIIDRGGKGRGGLTGLSGRRKCGSRADKGSEKGGLQHRYVVLFYRSLSRAAESRRNNVGGRSSATRQLKLKWKIASGVVE